MSYGAWMRKARAQFPTGTVMNRTEERYAREFLEPRLLAREILWYRYECWKLVLGHKMSYTPDFIVVKGDGGIECHEVKSVWSTDKVGFKDDARIKIKAAAESYPFLSFIVAAYDAPRRRGRAGGWQFEDIPSRDDGLPNIVEKRSPPPKPKAASIEEVGWDGGWRHIT